MLKLNFEIVPTSCWYNNLRHILSKRAWDYIRKDAYQKANGKCTICNAPKKRLEAHERWSYDITTHTQKLKDIIAICHNCHSVIHIGRTQLVGKEDIAIRHFKKVNNTDYQGYITALKKANEESIELSKIDDWQLDLSYLQTYLEE
jgi:hypothetical protein